MATLTAYSDTSDGDVESFASTWAGARAGTGTLTVDDTGTTSILLGRRASDSDWYVSEGFLSFDTSSIGGGTVNSATLSLFEDFTNNTDDWTEVRARLFDWGAGVTTGDFRATDGTSASDTLLSTLARTAITSGAYNAFTSESAFANNINGSGDTRLYTLISLSEGATEPTGINFWRYSTAEVSGTTEDPKLVVTYTTISISSVTPSTFADGDTGVTIAGSGFEASQGTGKVELGDSSDYATATLVEQTITSWSDTSIDFTVVQGALDSGTVYVFVTNDSGSTTAGFEAGLIYEASVAASLAPLTVALQAKQVFSGSVASALPPLAAALSGEMQYSGTLATALPVLQTSMAAELPGGITITLPALQASATGEHSQSGAAATELPALAAALAGAQSHEGSVTQALPALQAALAGSQLYTATMAVALPMLAAQFSQEQTRARYPYVGRASTVSPAPGRARLKES